MSRRDPKIRFFKKPGYSRVPVYTRRLARPRPLPVGMADTPLALQKRMFSFSQAEATRLSQVTGSQRLSATRIRFLWLSQSGGRRLRRQTEQPG